MSVVDLRHELTRPLALILAAFAALGWVMFGLSSWSAASVQKTQRLQIMDVTEKSERLGAELAKQASTTAAVADLEKKADIAREELNRLAAMRSDVAAEIAGAQKRLTTVRREVTDADRTLAIQNQKLSESQNLAAEAAAAASDPDSSTTPSPRAGRGAKRGGGRWTRRGRSYRSYSIMSKTR